MVTIRNVLRCALLVCAFATQSGMAVDDAAVPRGQLPRHVLPVHYDLALRIDPRADGFDGEVRIQVRMLEATRRFWMHGRDLDIASAVFRAEGSKEDVALKTAVVDVSGVLQVDAEQLLPAGNGELRFRYHAGYDTQLEGTYKVKVDGESYVMTQMEAISARKSFPCFDEPAFKTPWDVQLTVPKADKAVANTRLLSTGKQRDGWKRLRFATTEALPTYLLAYAVGPWDIVDAPALPPNAQRKTALPFRGIAVKGRGKEMAYALETTPAIVAALEEYFGSAFPFDKLDILAAPDFGAGAMENAGLILYRDSLLLLDEQSPIRIRQGYFTTNTHELAHQWFGNLVTMPWWDDIWLNEGFASWMESKITERLRPEFHVDRQRVESMAYAMEGDALTSSRQIREPIRDFTEIEAAFDGITYSKGEAVLTMFESYLGETRFRDGIRDYLRAHARGNATSDDLIEALAARSDTPVRVAAAMRSFLDQSGVPLLAVNVKCDDGRAALSVRQSRYLPLGSTAASGRDWGVPFCARYAVGDKDATHCALIDSETAEVALPTDSCPAWVMPNANGTGYYRFTLDPASQRALDTAFDRLNDREQHIAADSLGAAFDAGKISLADYLAMVPRLVAARSRQVATSPAATLTWLREHQVRDATGAAALRAFVGRLYGPLLQKIGIDARAADDDEVRLTRAAIVALMSDEARDPETRRQLAARARRLIGMDGAKADPTAIASDMYDNALRVLIQDGGKVEFDAVEARLHASQDSLERANYLFALGSTTNPELQARAFSLSLGDKLQAGEIGATIRGAMRFPETRATARAWVHAHADALIARMPSGRQRYLSAIDASGACSDAEADAMEQFWEPRVKNMDGGPRALAQFAEATRLCSVMKDHYAQEELSSTLAHAPTTDAKATTPAAP
jgi:alanyl aminopeptidase